MPHPKTRAKIARIANEWLGTAFHTDAQIKGVGCDCAGLIIGVANEVLGIEISRENGIEPALATFFHKTNTPKISDIVVFAKPELAGEFHAAILLDGMIIHSRQNRGVILNTFTQNLRKMVAAYYSFRC